MLAHAWLFVGVIGILATIAAVTTSDDGVAIISGVLGFIAWGIWSFGALHVEVADGGNGAVTTFSMPELTILGVALALLPGYIALTGPVEIVSRARNTSAKDV